MSKLHIGCGRTRLDGYINIDSVAIPGVVDVVCNLEEPPFPFEADSVTEIIGNHVLEHISNSLGLMQELHRIARPGATATFRVPYGSSDDADEDPTHVRRYFINSWGYFSQPFYWRADYGYRGDWEVSSLTLVINNVCGKWNDASWETIFEAVKSQRNVVQEMVAVLTAIKPIREPLRSLQASSKRIIAFNLSPPPSTAKKTEAVGLDDRYFE